MRILIAEDAQVPADGALRPLRAPCPASREAVAGLPPREIPQLANAQRELAA